MKKNKFERLIFAKLYSKYKVDNTIYALNLIDNIIFNERSHLVSTFKDYLILDDEYEFLKRYYTFKESNVRLFNYINYYSNNKIQYPNYSNLREGDIILKNIFIKQQMAENLEKSFQKRKRAKNKIKIDSNENLSNTVFNSKVYDSIINDSENCLSIFSNDKESLYSGNNYDSKNKKDEGINKLLNCFEAFDQEAQFSFKKNLNNKKLKIDNCLIKELKLDVDNTDNKFIKENNFQTIYRKKKTPNNSINKRSNILSNSSKTQRYNHINTNENMDYINYKNLILYSESNHNQMDNLYKNENKNKNKIINPVKNANNSSLFYFHKSRGNSDNNKKIKYTNIIKNNKRKISILNANNKQLNNNINIGESKIKGNLLTERIPPMIKVKINLKKNDLRINNTQKQAKIINKNTINDSINKKQKIKQDKNKIYISNSNHLTNTKFKGVISKLNKKNENSNSNNNKNDIFMKSLEKFDTRRSNSNNILKDSKISLIKKNMDYNMNTDYIINKYKNKLSNYNNYTSIQFNNNNINIINSNSNNINNNTNDLFNNTYGSYMRKADEMTIINNLSNNPKINNNNKSLEFKNKRKKLNKKCATYFFSNNSEKLDPKFKFKKKLKFINNLNLMNENNATTINCINNLSQHHRGLNSERISTPFNHKLNKKIFFKIYKKVNLSNNKEKKNQTIINDEFKKYKISFGSKQKYSDFSTINNTDNFDKFNYTHMSLFNKTNTNMNSSILNNNNYNTNFINGNSSLYKQKRNKNASDIIYYKNNEKVDFLNNNFEMNISNIFKDDTKEKKNSNILGKIIKKKNVKKDDEYLEIKKLDEKKKMIINEFNEKMNQIKLNFIKEIENKYEISKRNIINKRRNKNKLNVNTNIIKY